MDDGEEYLNIKKSEYEIYFQNKNSNRKIKLNFI